MTPLPQFGIERLAYIGLTTQDAVGLCDFFERALGFRLLTAGWKSAMELGGLAGTSGGAYRVTLGLGGQVVELLQFDRPGQPYPDDVSAADLCFQHFAIVVSNMELAYQRLCSSGRWSAISTAGPQRLPSSSGGITAFKFRDPEGHPLELLAFPPGRSPPHWKGRSRSGLFLGIDHSAIGVSDSARSIAFYAGLGLRMSTRSLNGGSEQERLDGVSRPQVDVTALQPRQSTPHLELLHYRTASNDEIIALRNNDVAATRLVFEASRRSIDRGSDKRLLTDPDGHHILIVESSEDDAELSIGAYATADACQVAAKSETAR
jgi:catechol 2,3-dioxygenase-like lactoylglutathione lyase family enzyme